MVEGGVKPPDELKRRCLVESGPWGTCFTLRLSYGGGPAERSRWLIRAVSMNYIESAKVSLNLPSFWNGGAYRAG